ncbi:MAG TPA: regulatory protein RecX [Thermoanaerobaculia bacterium]|nr:regulatory protein RecX [Thermoanaerobaculia bacterium]
MPDDLERCNVAAMRILNHRFNSEGELRRKLEMKEFARDVIETTIERLRRERWLDDGRFATAYVRTRVRKGIGLLRIKRELVAAGVESDTIAHALDESVPDHDERAAALVSARKRLAVLLRRDDDASIREKLVAYLFRQGYDSSVAVDVVRELMAYRSRDDQWAPLG